MASKLSAKLAELVVAALQVDPVRQRSLPGQSGGVGDAPQRSEHAARQDPAAHQTDDEQEDEGPHRLREGRRRSEVGAGLGTNSPGPAGTDPGDVIQIFSGT